MAKPDIENGFTRIANELLEALVACRDMSGSEMRLFLFLVRATYGYRRKEAEITVEEIKSATGLPRASLYRVRDELVRRRMVSFEEVGRGAAIYRINKDWEQWEADVCLTDETSLSHTRDKPGENVSRMRQVCLTDETSLSHTRDKFVSRMRQTGWQRRSSVTRFGAPKENKERKERKEINTGRSFRREPRTKLGNALASAQSESYVSTVDVMREFLAKKKAEEEGRLVEN